ncbi:type II toxin-antitoxin system CcdA family antitoxin [Rhodococcus rhodochrous]|uniref:Clp protease N-terminal domain-containing protein n=1 Tax=Rhodococcus rhodochrous TaxID=1829 RepID=UPI001E5D2A47|nr:Clp protease N-terminal domain-containing protein [Rhodococcus rhodochrous]MCB8914060.1 type II toxin-antitoxin system CcdA family antitoxin [Rhodococcus rhodochrous]
MPKINVYLPDDLAAKVRAAELPISAICQVALREAVDQAQAEQEASTDVLPLSPHVAATVALAPAAAARRGSTTVETEDLLQALLDEGENLVLRGLERLGVSLSALQAALEAHVEVASSVAVEDVRVGESVATVLSAASDDARLDGNDTINSSNLVWALATAESGRSSTVLDSLGFGDRISREALGLIEIGFRYGRGRQPAQATLLTELARINQRLDLIERVLGKSASENAGARSRRTGESA